MTLGRNFYRPCDVGSPPRPASSAIPRAAGARSCRPAFCVRLLVCVWRQPLAVVCPCAAAGAVSQRLPAAWERGRGASDLSAWGTCAPGGDGGLLRRVVRCDHGLQQGARRRKPHKKRERCAACKKAPGRTCSAHAGSLPQSGGVCVCVCVCVYMSGGGGSGIRHQGAQACAVAGARAAGFASDPGLCPRATNKPAGRADAVRVRTAPAPPPKLCHSRTRPLLRCPRVSQGCGSASRRRATRRCPPELRNRRGRSRCTRSLHGHLSRRGWLDARLRVAWRGARLCCASAGSPRQTS